MGRNTGVYSHNEVNEAQGGAINNMGNLTNVRLSSRSQMRGYMYDSTDRKFKTQAKLIQAKEVKTLVIF